MSMNPSDLVSTRRSLHKSIQHWACGETHKNEDQMSSEMLELFDMWGDAAVGIESFTLRQLAVELSPVTVKAKIEYGLWLAEKWEAEEVGRDVGRPRRVWIQSASTAKTKLTDDRQHDFGLWVPGKDHKRDAIKHCYTFLSRTREQPRLRYLAWPNLFKQDGTPLKRRPSVSNRSLI
jgi:hypothetical protein